MKKLQLEKKLLYVLFPSLEALINQTHIILLAFLKEYRGEQLNYNYINDFHSLYKCCLVTLRMLPLMYTCNWTCKKGTSTYFYELERHNLLISSKYC